MPLSQSGFRMSDDEGVGVGVTSPSSIYEDDNAKPMLNNSGSKESITDEEHCLLEERIALWTQLVPPYEDEVSQTSEINIMSYSNDDEIKNLNKKIQNDLYDWKSYDFTTGLLGATIGIIGIGVFIAIILSLETKPMPTTAELQFLIVLTVVLFFFSLLIIKFSYDSIRYLYKLSKFNAINKKDPSESASYIIKQPITLVNKPLPIEKHQSIRNAVYWQEGNKQLLTNNIWLNNWDNKDYPLYELNKYYPNLFKILIRTVRSYPVKKEQVPYLINPSQFSQEEKNTITQKALREFMTYDNDLSLHDLQVLHNAVNMMKQLDNANIPFEIKKMKINTYLDNHFQEKEFANTINHTTKKEQIQKIKESLDELFTYPDNVYQQLENASVQDLEESQKQISQYVDSINNMIKANPHLMFQSGLKYIQSHDMPLSALTKHIKAQYQEIAEHLCREIEQKTT